MVKAEKGTPKDIGNKIKAKGLQKLKFYCQMCEKQCRDANGFKCHLTSENHLRQMKIFSDNAGGILDQYSKDFEKFFMATLRMRHGTKRVNANNIYQEVIQDKQHIHMNATHWTTLTDFVQYLGKMGKCVVEETERGWYVQYIERDANILARQENLQRRVAADKAAEQAEAERMEIQRVEAAKALDRAGGTVHNEATNLERAENDETIKLALTQSIHKKPSGVKAKRASVFGDDDDEEEEEEEIPKPKFEPQLPSAGRDRERRRGDDTTRENRKIQSRDEQKSHKRPKEESDKSSSKRPKHDDDRKDYWLHRNIIVRVVSKKLADGKYFKRKAIVDRVIDKYTAEVEVLDSDPDARDGGDILRLDQDDLETVIPKEGKQVRILNGRERGQKAIVTALDKKRCKGSLKLEHDNTILEGVQYEDFSKVA
jgi:DNA/RNA-binding protein KIN17